MFVSSRGNLFEARAPHLFIQPCLLKSLKSAAFTARLLYSQWSFNTRNTIPLQPWAFTIHTSFFILHDISMSNSIYPSDTENFPSQRTVSSQESSSENPIISSQAVSSGREIVSEAQIASAQPLSSSSRTRTATSASTSQKNPEPTASKQTASSLLRPLPK